MRRVALALAALLAGCSQPAHDVSIEIRSAEDHAGRSRSSTVTTEVSPETAAAIKAELTRREASR